MDSNKAKNNPYLEEDLDEDLFPNEDQIFADEIDEENKPNLSFEEQLEEFEKETEQKRHSSRASEDAKLFSKVSKNEEIINILLKKVNFLERELKKNITGEINEI